jgi:hypothetical protein
MVEGWDGDVLWLKITEDQVKINYERNTPPNPAKYYTHARSTIQSPPYDMAKLPELQILQQRYAEPSAQEFKMEERNNFTCDLCNSSMTTEEQL